VPVIKGGAKIKALNLISPGIDGNMFVHNSFYNSDCRGGLGVRSPGIESTFSSSSYIATNSSIALPGFLPLPLVQEVRVIYDRLAPATCSKACLQSGILPTDGSSTEWRSFATLAVLLERLLGLDHNANLRPPAWTSPCEPGGSYRALYRTSLQNALLAETH
jgi:hypothetical protein